MTYVEKTGDLVRSDGLVERRGRWKDLGVGMSVFMAGRKWKIIESAIPQQFAYGHSLWFRFEAPKGEVVNYPPQLLNRSVTLLLDPEAEPLEPTLPSNVAEINLLVDKLGATEIATKDKATGEVWCPAYAAGHRHADEYGEGTLLRQEIYHLGVAHGLDVRGLEGIQDHDERLLAVIKVHGDLHSGRMVGTGGFPHRHVPEDLSII